MSKSKSKAGEEFLTTIGDGISEAGSAVLGIFTGGDSMSSREYKLEKDRIAAEALKAEAEAEKEAALYSALSGTDKSRNFSVQKITPATSKPGMSFRLKKIAKGVVAGGAAGFVTGSVVPVIGNMAGLVGGAILGGFAADSLE